MKPNEQIEGNAVEAVVGVFETPAEASRAAASLRGADVKVQRVSAKNPASTDGMPNLVYEHVESVDESDVNQGMLKGAAIGAGSGLLLFAVPGLNIAAPIAGALAGAFIGGVAGVDETKRAIELPNEVDYKKMLSEGKSFVVLGGTEKQRIDYAIKMEELGASETHQHPPVRHAVRGSNP